MITNEDCVQVAVRVRPTIDRESNLPVLWKVSGNEIVSYDEAGHSRNYDRYAFDYIFDTTETNGSVYNIVQPMVLSATEGINSTIFAYGQTSSGKTHSIMGAKNDKGIIERAIDDIFDKVETTSDRKYLIRAQYFEIYNEKIYDLLNRNSKNLKVKEDYSGNVFVDCQEYITSSRDILMGIVQQGNKFKIMGETQMNERSSRSHVILKIIIESSIIPPVEQNDDDDVPIQVSNLYIVDLAGSEKTAHSSGVRMKEGVHINKSLSTLALVIRQLSDRAEYISFRDSKLTRILSNSLRGNSKILILATITPVTFENSQSTLQFAKCARNVVTKPLVNKVLTGAALIKRHREKEKELIMALKMEKEKNIHLETEKEQEKQRIRDLEEQLLAIQKDFVAIRPLQQAGLKRRHTVAVASDKPKFYTLLSNADESSCLAETLRKFTPLVFESQADDKLIIQDLNEQLERVQLDNENLRARLLWSEHSTTNRENDLLNFMSTQSFNETGSEIKQQNNTFSAQIVALKEKIAELRVYQQRKLGSLRRVVSDSTLSDDFSNSIENIARNVSELGSSGQILGEMIKDITSLKSIILADASVQTLESDELVDIAGLLNTVDNFCLAPSEELETSKTSTEDLTNMLKELILKNVAFKNAEWMLHLVEYSNTPDDVLRHLNTLFIENNRTLEKSNEQMEKITKDIKVLTSENQQLLKKSADIHKLNSDLESRNSELELEKRGLVKRFEELSKTVGECEQALKLHESNDLQKENDRLSTELSQVKAQHTKVVVAGEALKRFLHEKEELLKAMNLKIRDIETKVETLENDEVYNKATIEILQNQVNKQETVKEDICCQNCNELNKKVLDLEENEKSLNKNLTLLQNQIIQLKEIKKSESEPSDEKRDCTRCMKLTDELQQLQIANKELDDEVIGSLEKIKDLRMAIKESDLEIKQLKGHMLSMEMKKINETISETSLQMKLENLVGPADKADKVECTRCEKFQALEADVNIRLAENIQLKEEIDQSVKILTDCRMSYEKICLNFNTLSKEADHLREEIHNEHQSERAFNNDLEWVICISYVEKMEEFICTVAKDSCIACQHLNLIFIDIRKQIMSLKSKFHFKQWLEIEIVKPEERVTLVQELYNSIFTDGSLSNKCVTSENDAKRKYALIRLEFLLNVCKFIENRVPALLVFHKTTQTKLERNQTICDSCKEKAELTIVTLKINARLTETYFLFQSDAQCVDVVLLQKNTLTSLDKEVDLHETKLMRVVKLRNKKTTYASNRVNKGIQVSKMRVPVDEQFKQLNYKYNCLKTLAQDRLNKLMCLSKYLQLEGYKIYGLYEEQMDLKVVKQPVNYAELQFDMPFVENLGTQPNEENTQ